MKYTLILFFFLSIAMPSFTRNIEDKIFNLFKHKKTKKLNVLLKNKLKLKLEDQNGNSILHYLAFQGNFNLIKLIIKKKMNINHKNNLGRNPLYMTSFKESYSHLACAKILINHGVDVNSIDNRGYTTLIQATIIKNLKLMKFLLKNKANPNIKTKKGYTALSIAWGILLSEKNKATIDQKDRTNKSEKIIDLLEDYNAIKGNEFVFDRFKMK